MNPEHLRKAKQKFKEAKHYGSENHAVNLLAEGLSSLSDALLEMSREIEGLKAKAGREQG